MAIEDLRYDRVCRTTLSEAYLISQGEEPMARVDLHFTQNGTVYGLLVIERELDEDDLQDLIDQIDNDLVMSADLPRDDFLVTVYHGREVGTFSESQLDLDQEDQEEDGAASQRR